jgi:hypothetical protein
MLEKGIEKKKIGRRRKREITITYGEHHDKC